ncbi:hypothetical protein BC833DRAFT_647569 [Globomyces pollinis-pini]|nr:hypothetical protein BC833DRAFT_647569 [Globomyces pollinis-pini]
MSEESGPTFITGSFVMYRHPISELGQPGIPLPEIHNIEVGEKIIIDNPTEIKLIGWNYPSNHFTVHFYKDANSTKPYVTAVGPSSTKYLVNISNWNTVKDLDVILDKDEIGSWLIKATLAAPLPASELPPYITGSIGFSTGCSIVEEIPEMVNIDVGRIIQPINSTKYKSMIWSYPSKNFRIDFYLAAGSCHPYASVVGPNRTSYLGTLCGFDTYTKGFDVTVDKFQVNNTQFLFANRSSFAVVSLT